MTYTKLEDVKISARRGMKDSLNCEEGGTGARREDIISVKAAAAKLLLRRASLAPGMVATRRQL